MGSTIPAIRVRGRDMKRANVRACNGAGKKLDKRFVAYTLAAAGAAAMAKPASAEIVFTPVNISLTEGVYPIDFNGDGLPEFAIHNYLGPYSSSTYANILKIGGGKGATTASVIGIKNGNSPSAWDAPINWPIGQSSPKGFVGVTHRLARMVTAGGGCCKDPIGPWKSATNRFLGFKFTLNGQVHYGWARMTVSTTFDVVKATLTGYAYETIPNKAILAGDKGPSVRGSSAGGAGPSLAMLSLGAPGLEIWRRD